MKTSKTTSFSTRLSQRDRCVINQAAKFHGCSPSNFIRDAAVTQAEEALSDPETFALSRIRRLMKGRPEALTRAEIRRAEIRKRGEEEFLSRERE